MAIIDKKGRLHGKLGKLNYRVLKNGLEVISTLPRRVRQTRATKESGLEFGLASSTAFYIRRALAGLTHFSDGSMINRLNAAVLACIKGNMNKLRGDRDLHDGDLSLLKGFEFNLNNTVKTVLPVVPECVLTPDKRIQVHIPAFHSTDLVGPSSARVYSFQLVLTVVNFKEKYYETLDYIDLPVEHSVGLGNEFNWQPEVEIPSGCIAMVSLGINYACYNSNTRALIQLNSVEFSPTQIIGAFSIAADPIALPHKNTENTSLIADYKGPEMFARIEKLRLKDPKYQRGIAGGMDKSVRKVIPSDLVKGKVFFDKPGSTG